LEFPPTTNTPPYDSHIPLSDYAPVLCSSGFLLSYLQKIQLSGTLRTFSRTLL